MDKHEKEYLRLLEEGTGEEIEAYKQMVSDLYNDTGQTKRKVKKQITNLTAKKKKRKK